jgi:DNA-binding HxlR family transcriptional regulator
MSSASLILRDIHTDPGLSYQLHEGLGVVTNLLTSRLVELSESGVIQKLDVDRHSAYALSDLGRHTDLRIRELSRVGGLLNPEPDPRQPGNLRGIVLPLRIAAAVTALGTSLTDIAGIGPIGAATSTGYTNDITWFPTRGHYETHKATAPIEVSSAGNTPQRLNLRGNRTLNHTIHIAAVTQLRHDTNGRIYYNKKIAEGKTPKEATRALKQPISDAVYQQLKLDASQTWKAGSGRTNRDASRVHAASSNPEQLALWIGHSGTLMTTLRPLAALRQRFQPTRPNRTHKQPLGTWTLRDGGLEGC